MAEHSELIRQAQEAIIRTDVAVDRDIVARLVTALETPPPVPHCETCYCGKRAPVQGEHDREHRRAAGTVTWDEHLEAYTAYADRYGNSQSAERLAERGGFGYTEITKLLGHEPTTWRVR